MWMAWVKPSSCVRDYVQVVLKKCLSREQATWFAFDAKRGLLIKLPQMSILGDCAENASMISSAHFHFPMMIRQEDLLYIMRKNKQLFTFTDKVWKYIGNYSELPKEPPIKLEEFEDVGEKNCLVRRFFYANLVYCETT
jgi:hypothetical protein